MKVVQIGGYTKYTRVLNHSNKKKSLILFSFTNVYSGKFLFSKGGGWERYCKYIE